MGSTLTFFTHRNKAVAVGAVSYYVDHFVTGRISKFTYGTPWEVVYQPLDPEHVKREHKSYVDPLGDKRVPDGFATLLLRVCHPSAPHRSSETTSLRYRVLRFRKTMKFDRTSVISLKALHSATL